MQLTHVCIWDQAAGYRRVTIEEACKRFPYGVSAQSGHFVCGLCAQNVTLTAPSDSRVRHFRHDSASISKECEERQAYYDSNYGRSIYSLNSHSMPLRLAVTSSSFSLQIGFFHPPEGNAHCERIRISGDAHQLYEYSFERIESVGTTYLNVGIVPSRVYGLEYVNANAELKKYWPTKISGANPAGSIFDGKTGRLILSGGKAYFGNSYYLLQQRVLYNAYQDIEVTEIHRIQTSEYASWYLYRIQIKSFSAESAKFFLRYQVFLTEKPTKYYPIWPAYVKDPTFICHNSNVLYFYMCGDDAELKSFPAYATESGTKDGKLYRLNTREREQLVSFGKSGALGFSYLIKQPLSKEAPLPSIIIYSNSGEQLIEEEITTLPKFISVSCKYDGKAVVQRKGKTIQIYNLSAEQRTEIDELSFGSEICFYQGHDCVRVIRFIRNENNHDAVFLDDALAKQLKACSGSMIPMTHSIASLASKYHAYPQTKQWLYQLSRQEEIPRKAVQLLLDNIPNDNRRNKND